MDRHNNNNNDHRHPTPRITSPNSETSLAAGMQSPPFPPSGAPFGEFFFLFLFNRHKRIGRDFAAAQPDPAQASPREGLFHEPEIRQICSVLLLTLQS